jgi:L-asparaginase
MIRIIVTGGTFDKEYNELNGQLFFKETHIQEMLRLGRNLNEVSISTLMLIDSLDMNDSHRHQIIDACKACNEEKIIITHGTDTMTETARVMAEADLKRTVVITGAMIPYTFGSSDGLFNLGSAMAFVQTLPHGVYVVMNGKCFDWNNVRKNKGSGIFEEL